MPLEILIIDDDASFRRLLELRLKSFLKDMQATILPSLGEARTYLKSDKRPQLDLVILDEHLPDGRGVELLQEGWFQNLTVLTVSSDDAPEIPGATVQAGAAYFLNKRHVSEPLFQPLILGIMERNRLSRELEEARLQNALIDTVKTLVGTLRHEINNPLGAVLGAAYLLRENESATPELKEAAKLVESSGQRIKYVLDELCQAVELEPVTKANQKVFHIPGDEPWQEGGSSASSDEDQ